MCNFRTYTGYPAIVLDGPTNISLAIIAASSGYLVIHYKVVTIAVGSSSFANLHMAMDVNELMTLRPLDSWNGIRALGPKEKAADQSFLENDYYYGLEIPPGTTATTINLGIIVSHFS
jgi:hypothetical protein